MQQELLLNIIPFDPPTGKQKFAFYKQKQADFYPVFMDDLQGLLDDKLSALELLELNKLYTDFQPAKDGAIELEIDLSVSHRFANHYYRYLIRDYFMGIADIIHQNFTSETEVWFHDKDKSNTKYNVYNQFTVKVQYARVTDKPEIVLSYDGTTKVFAKPVSEIYNFNTNLYNWIVCNGILYKWKFRPQEVINMPDKCFPVLSNDIKPHLEIAHDVPNLTNRYPRYLNVLQDFYTTYFDNDTFRSLIPIGTNGFYKPVAEQYRVISSSSNDLLYSGGKTGKEPKKDFKSKGPYQLPQKPSNFKFFFIYQQSDKASAVTELYKYLNSGWKDDRFPFPKMQDYIKVPFELDISKNVEFDTVQNAVAAVKNAVKNAEWLPDTQYMALFVNPVPKMNYLAAELRGIRTARVAGGEF